MNIPIQMEILRDATGDDQKGMRYLSYIYLENSTKSFGKIADAIQTGDPKALQLAAHGCAGSSASFGAETLSDLLHELEKMGREASLTSAPLKLAECWKEFSRVVVYLKHLFPPKTS